MTKKRLHQIAALPYRRHGKGVDVLLITSRETKRWVVPKGWPMEGKTDWVAAAVEAFEEAGLEGNIGEQSLGIYNYIKRKKSGEVECEVTVYPLEVSELLRNWPERHQRKRKWFSARVAADKVNEAGLKAIIEATLT